MMRVYVLIAVALALAGTHFWMYRHGKEAARAEAQESVMAAKEREDQAILALQKQEKQIEIIYRDRIKIVKESTDACMATPLPAAVLDSLRTELPPG